jgi:hypothetical protein
MTGGHDYTYYDETTMVKVWEGLAEAGLNKPQIARAVASMMKQGILFREEARQPAFYITYDPPKPRRAWGRRTR